MPKPCQETFQVDFFKGIELNVQKNENNVMIGIDKEPF